MKHYNIIASNNEAYTLADVALCVWEEVLRREHASRTLRQGTDNDPAYTFFQQHEGVAHARSNVIETAYWFELAYQFAVDRYDWDHGFDWEFIPRALDYFIDVCDTPDDITEIRAREAARYASNDYDVGNQPE